jgi:predicted nucleic acid-binding protein
VTFLIDTNVISELRKGEKADRAVLEWMSQVDEDDLYLSVLVVGEIRKGVERVRRRDRASAQALETWLRQITTAYAERVLPITTEIAEAWGRLNVPDPLPVIDSLLSATAQVHGMTVATRNVADISRTGVPVLNPFDDSY